MKDSWFFYLGFSLKADLGVFKMYIFNLNLKIYGRLHKAGSGKEIRT